MVRYTSKTGKDVTLKFKGTEIIIPANGYYESQGEDLAILFPDHVRRVELANIIKDIENRLLPLNIKEIKSFEIVPIVLPVIHEAALPRIERAILNTPKEISLPLPKEVQLRSENNKLITETINDLINNSIDPDIREFLLMIADILKEK